MSLSLFDRLAIKVAITVEKLVICFLIMSPLTDDALRKIVKMNRDRLKYQLIGYNYLNNNKMQLPREAEEKYIMSGRLIIVLLFVGLVSKLSSVVGSFIK